MSHHGCRYCGGATPWYSEVCRRCKLLWLADIEREAKMAAEATAAKFRDALIASRNSEADRASDVSEEGGE